MENGTETSSKTTARAETAGLTETQPEAFVAGLFTMARTAVAGSSRHAEQWLAYGEAQLAETARVMGAMRRETESAVRAFAVAGEDIAARGTGGMARFFGSFDRSAS